MKTTVMLSKKEKKRKPGNHRLNLIFTAKIKKKIRFWPTNEFEVCSLVVGQCTTEDRSIRFDSSTHCNLQAYRNGMRQHRCDR